MHAGLAELDRLPAHAPVLSGEPADGPIDHPTRFGLQALARFVETAEPEFGPLFLDRLPAGAEPGARHEVLAEPRPVHREHIVKLVRRRLAPWSAIIG